ncbi:hypothetical protein [Streptomyces hydrogenans]|uniref:hypothetical protein n=1 Tax=Streptomyces hydrogenans TaxID=1873719 RepID=UPI003815C9D8
MTELNINDFHAPRTDPPLPNDSNTFSTALFRKEQTDCINRADYADEVTFIRHTNRDGRIVGVLVPPSMYAEYLRLRAWVAELSTAPEMSADDEA